MRWRHSRYRCREDAEMIAPRRDLDDEHTRLLTFEQAQAASVEHLDAVTAISADVSATIAGAAASNDIHPLVADQLTDEFADELTYRAALAALSGVVQRSLRDFLS
jgi:hypothetical protein